MNQEKRQLIVALDVDTLDEAKSLIEKLKKVVDIFKVGSHLFTSSGPDVVRYLHSHGKRVFLDLKYNDIPNTVSNAVKQAVGLGGTIHEVIGGDIEIASSKQHLFMCSVHTAGGKEMLEAAVQVATEQSQNIGVTKTLIIGITVLTSEEKGDNIQQIVLERVRLAKESGLDGIVASSQEAATIRKECGEDFIIVTPGIRPKGSKADDQKRIATPFDAISNGSNYLVVGRPIIKAKDPVTVTRQILEDIKQAQVH